MPKKFWGTEAVLDPSSNLINKKAQEDSLEYAVRPLKVAVKSDTDHVIHAFPSSISRRFLSLIRRLSIHFYNVTVLWRVCE